MRHPASNPQDAARSTRLLAGAVLIPAVPLLCLSVAALALFYASPGRLDRVLALLPGDQFLRLALFFAPATLFAIVVMALLYALEPPRPAPIPAARPAPARPAPKPRLLPAMVAGTMTALLLSVALLLLSFVAPGRFGLLIEPLPGDRYLRTMIRLAPFVFSAALVVLASLAARRPGQAPGRGEPGTPWSAAVWSVRLLLIPTIPLLLFSLGALVLYYGAPSRFETLMATLGSEAFIRLVLFFAPFLLFAVIALASLYLGRPSRPGVLVIDGPAVPADRLEGAPPRSMWAVALLSAGLTATAMLGVAGIGVVAYLLLR
ncbi:MAG: hypothetical protein MUO23_02440 [Anaerolineales bacterium]|nr:hypothetical protein [Anaerolineales bacterium]